MSYFDRTPWMRAPFRFALIALGVLAADVVVLCRAVRPWPWTLYLPFFAIPILNAIFVIPAVRKQQRTSCSG